MIIPANPGWYILRFTFITHEGEQIPSGFDREAVIAWEILESTTPMPIGIYGGLSGPHDHDGLMEPCGAILDIGTGVRYSDRMEWFTAWVASK